MGILAIVHKYASYLFLAWVIIHIAGVMVEQFWHKTSMVFAMITGYKRTKGEDTKVKSWLTVFAFMMIFIAIGTYFFIVSSNYNFLTLRKYTNIDYEEQHPVYFKTFYQAFGSANWLNHASICLQTVASGYGVTIGAYPQSDLDNAEYIIMAGANRAEAIVAPDTMDAFKRTKGRGAKLICIDPRFTNTAAKADK